MDEKEPRQRAKNQRNSSLGLAFTMWKPLRRHFHVVFCVWEHVMTHHVSNAPLPIVEAIEVHEEHSPVIFAMKKVVTRDGDEGHADSGNRCHPTAVKFSCQKDAEDCGDGKSVSNFLKLFFFQLVSLARKIEFTFEAFAAFLLTTVSWSATFPFNDL